MRIGICSLAAQTGIERALNGGRPLVHRCLDRLIVQKLETGEWQALEKSGYLFGGRSTKTMADTLSG
ncbi:MAG TPA: hypothetical protein VJU82_10265, partial [Acidobacteriaceae bacterium]|nr:hypothetical protein [Acidobacteriaceae bacterium]